MRIDPPTGVFTARLVSGVNVHHRLMDFRRGQVVVRLALSGGRIDETARSLGATEAAAGALTRMWGRARRDRPDESYPHISAIADDDALVVRAAGPSETLPEILAAMRALLDSPSIDEEDFHAWKERRAEVIEHRVFRFNWTMRLLIEDALLPEHHRIARLTGADELNEITLDTTRRELARLVERAPVEIAITGDAPRRQALDAAVGAFADLPTRAHATPDFFPDRLRAPRTPRSVHAFVHSEVDHARVWVGAPGAQDLPDRRLLNLAAHTLSRRLEAAHPGANVYVLHQSNAVHPALSRLSLSLAAPPRLIPEARASIEAHVLELARTGPTAAELEAARTARIESRLARAEEPAYWASRLAEMNRRGYTIADITADERVYATASAQDVRDALRRALASGAFAHGVASPARFATAPEKQDTDPPPDAGG